MHGKLVIKADLKVLTGLHIGGGEAFSAIGAVDKPVVRDERTRLPVIPGSSLKGKIRTLLVRSQNNSIELPKIADDAPEIKRLFGAHAPEIVKARLQFVDSFLKNKEELEAVGLTEVKFENNINRATSEANPRQIERVISGAVFDFRVVYCLAGREDLKPDMELLAKGLRLLQMDYLGGHGTRGYGRVSFENFKLEAEETDLTDAELDNSDIHGLFKGVENYALLSL